MDFKEYSNHLLQITEQRLPELIPNFPPDEIYEPFRYIMEGGGKRIRPILTMLSCGAVSGNCESALDAACSIEIMHNFTLVHDDIMDNSPIRRGKETIHRKWDSAVAILSGDAMVGYAYRIMNTYNELANYPKIIDALTTSLIEVCEGQAYDMQFNSNQEVTLDNYILMIGKKTSALLQGCAILGALCGSADENQIKALNDYAYSVGIAFQIQDDLLDITADQAKFGKQIGQDILEGKKTFLILKAKELATDSADVALINQYFANNGLAASQVPDMKNLFIKLGIFEIAQSEIERQLELADNSIKSIAQNEYTAMLLELSKSLNKRSF